MPSERLSLAELEGFDPTARRGSGERRFCCPFCHGNRPRDHGHRCLAVNRAGLWNCHRCNRAGILDEFKTETPQKTKKIQAARASMNRRILGESRPPIARAVAEPSPPAKYDFAAELQKAAPVAGTPGEAYLKGRGIEDQLATAAGVLFTPALFALGPCVVFPFLDREGRQVAAAARSIQTAEKRTIKATAEGPHGGIFATPGAFAPDARPVIVEAPIDALSLAAAGFPAIALGGTSWPAWLIQRFAFRPLILGLDADGPGDTAAGKLAAELQRVGARPGRLRPPAKDWNDALRIHGKDQLAEMLSGVLDRNTAAKLETGGYQTPRPPATSPRIESYGLDSEPQDAEQGDLGPDACSSTLPPPIEALRLSEQRFPKVDPRRGTPYDRLTLDEKAAACSFSPVAGAEALQRRLGIIRGVPDHLRDYTEETRLVADIEAAAKKASGSD